MDKNYLLLAIAVTVVATFATRIMPFLFFNKKNNNKTLKYIEFYLPTMIMIILVFYAIKDVNFFVYPFGIAEIIGVLLALLLHLVFKHSLLSIVVSTIVYMVIVQKIL